MQNSKKSTAAIKNDKIRCGKYCQKNLKKTDRKITLLKLSKIVSQLLKKLSKIIGSAAQFRFANCAVRFFVRLYNFDAGRLDAF